MIKIVLFIVLVPFISTAQLAVLPESLCSQVRCSQNSYKIQQEFNLLRSAPAKLPVTASGDCEIHPVDVLEFDQTAVALMIIDKTKEQQLNFHGAFAFDLFTNVFAGLSYEEGLNYLRQNTENYSISIRLIQGSMFVYRRTPETYIRYWIRESRDSTGLLLIGEWKNSKTHLGHNVYCRLIKHN